MRFAPLGGELDAPAHVLLGECQPAVARVGGQARQRQPLVDLGEVQVEVLVAAVPLGR
jgi:hypothetical protein